MTTKILDLNLKSIDISKIELRDDEKTKHIAELTIPIIINAIIQYINQQRGIFKSDRTLFYSISPKLEEAIKNKKETIEITSEECGFIRKCFREAKLSPTSLLEPIENYVDSLSK